MIIKLITWDCPATTESIKPAIVYEYEVEVCDPVITGTAGLAGSEGEGLV